MYEDLYDSLSGRVRGLLSFVQHSVTWFTPWTPRGRGGGPAGPQAGFDGTQNANAPGRFGGARAPSSRETDNSGLVQDVRIKDRQQQEQALMWDRVS